MVDYAQIPGGPGYGRTAEDEGDRLFHSKEENAPILPGFSLTPGFGILERGTVIAKNASLAGRTGSVVPYCPSDYTNINTDGKLMCGRTFLVSDGVATTSLVRVMPDDAYRFVVGDEIVICDNTTGSEDLGPILSITYGRAYAEIAFTNAIGAVSFTTLCYANIHVKCGTATPWMDAVGLLTQTVQTGSGEWATNVFSVSVVVPGATVVYKDSVRNLDTRAMESLGMREHGLRLVM